MERLGSIVLYRMSPADIERLGRATQAHNLSHVLAPGDRVPMIITRDWAPAELVNGALVLEVDLPMRVVNVGEGPGPGQWQAREA